MACGVYLARVEGPYHFDDWVTPVGDPASQSLPAFFEHVAHTLRPLSKLGFAIEGSLGLGESAAARRGVSAFFHGVSSGLVFLIAARLGTGVWAALTTAVLFAVHPIHAQMVWALAGRGALMALSFSLGALLAQLRRRPWVAAGLLLCACMCRETSALFVFPLAAVELARRPKTLGAVFKRIEPSVTVVLLIVAFVVQNARYRQLIEYSARGRPLGWSIAGQIEAIPHGLLLWLRPSGQSIDHGPALSHSFASPGFWLGVFSIALLFVLCGLGIRTLRPPLAIGAAWVLAALLPTQSLIPKLDPLTERPLAAALAGAALLCAAAVRPVFRTPRIRSLYFGAWTVATLLLASSTLSRGALYASDVALWRDAANKSTTNARPHYNLALALLDAGRPDEANQSLLRARQIDPFDSEMRALAARLSSSLASPDRQ